MSNILAFAGTDTIELDGKLVNDLASEGDAITCEFTENTEIFDGKDGNHVVVSQQGHLNVTIRVLTNGETSDFLALKHSQQKADLASYVGFSCYFKKKTGDGSANIKYTIVSGNSGVVIKRPNLTFSQGTEAQNAIEEWQLNFPLCEYKKTE